MDENFRKEIMAMRALNLMFFNYTNEMLEEMLTIREFKHCWNEYLDSDKETHMQIWYFFFYKISQKSQIALLKIALKHYEEEATKDFDCAVETEIILKKHVAYHDAKKKNENK